MEDRSTGLTHGGEWPALKVEFLSLLASANPKQRYWWDALREELQTWVDRRLPAPPCMPELLRRIGNSIAVCSDPFLKRGISDALSVLNDGREALGRRGKLDDRTPSVDWVTILIHQLISPNLGDPAPFVQVAEDLARAGKGDSPFTLIPEEELEALWRTRLLLPGRGDDGRWGFWPIGGRDELARETESFWSRWDRIIRGFPALGRFQGTLTDLLRRHMSWHFVAALGDNDALALPVFATIRRGAGLGVEWIGFEKLKIGAEFQEEIEKAFVCGLEAWVSKNRAWRQAGEFDVRLTDGTTLEETLESRLILDARMVQQVWGSVSSDVLPLHGRSAGLAVAVGTIGLLADGLPNAAVWCSGSLGEPITDKFMRLNPKLKRPLIHDVQAAWQHTVGATLKAKLKAARVHGLAARIVMPSNTPSEVVRALGDELPFSSDLNECESSGRSHLAFGVHPICVPRISVAADASLPLSYRKFRYIGAPELRWAFAEGARPHFQGKSDPRAQSSFDLLQSLRDASCAVVCGPRSAGKSHLIAGAFTLARTLLRDVRRTGPRVTFIRLPFGETARWDAEILRLIMNHVGFPASTIEHVLWSGTWEQIAQAFVVAFRTYGPDVFILDGLEPLYLERRRTIMRRKWVHSVPDILTHVTRLLSESPVERDEQVSQVLGRIELVIERRTEPEPEEIAPAVKVVSPVLAGWDEDACFKAAVGCLVGGPQMALARRVLDVLSIFRGEFGANGLYSAVAELDADERELRATIEKLMTLRLVRTLDEGGQTYFLTNASIPNGTEDSGPLLREGQGVYHVHPLLRPRMSERHFELHVADREDIQWRRRVSLAREHLRAAAYYSPMLIPNSHHGLLPTEALLPESLLEAQIHLEAAYSILHSAALQTTQGDLLDVVHQAQGVLVRYFREPSLERTDYLTRKLMNARGQAHSFAAVVAFRNIIRVLRRIGVSAAHPEWYIQAADTLKGMDPNQAFSLFHDPSVQVAAADKDRIGKTIGIMETEKLLVKAVKRARDLTDDETWYVIPRTVGVLVGFMLRNGRTGIADLPGFTSEDAILQTWKSIADQSSRRGGNSRFPDSEPIMYENYCDVGDYLWLTGHGQAAIKTYEIGLCRMRAAGTKLYDKLIVRALGAPRLLNPGGPWSRLELTPAEMSAVSGIRYNRKTPDVERQCVAVIKEALHLALDA